MQIVTVQGSAAQTPEEAIALAVQLNLSITADAAEYMIIPGGLTQTDDGFIATVNFMLLAPEDIPMLQEMRDRAHPYDSDYGQDQGQLGSGDASDEEHEKIEEAKRGNAVEQEMHGFEEALHLLHTNDGANERASEQIHDREEKYEERKEEIETDFDEAAHDEEEKEAEFEQAVSVDKTATANGLTISPAPGLGESGNSARSGASGG